MKTFLASIILLSSGAVFAWGSTGHRVVGEVASRYLDVSVKLKVHKILKGQSLARVSTWPDEIKSDPASYQYTFNWHYTTWHSEDSEHSESEETASTGFLLKSISEQLSILKDSQSSEEQKSFALKFLVHLVGDLHMPLHVGNGTDQGGNLCQVSYMGKATNLHALWDEGLIDFSKLSYLELAKFVSEGRPLEEMKVARSGGILDWALESKLLVLTLYPADGLTSKDALSSRSYCKKEVHPNEIPKLSYEYAYRFMPVIEKRLFFAGVRLALLLNQHFH
jgi:hypothetical protein